MTAFDSQSEQNVLAPIDSLSPLLISEGPGILSLDDPMIMPDGELYLGVFCEQWHVHVSGYNFNRDFKENQRMHGSSSSRPSSAPPPEARTERYSVIGYFNEKPMIVVPGNNIRGWALTPVCPPILEKRVFNLAHFINGGGLYGRISTTSTGEVQQERQHATAGARSTR